LSLQFDKKLNALAESECTTRQVALFFDHPRVYTASKRLRSS